MDITLMMACSLRPRTAWPSYVKTLLQKGINISSSTSSPSNFFLSFPITAFPVTVTVPHQSYHPLSYTPQPPTSLVSHLALSYNDL